MQQWGRARCPWDEHHLPTGSHPSTVHVTAGEEGAGRGLRVACGDKGRSLVWQPWAEGSGERQASPVLTFTFLDASCTPLGALVALTVGGRSITGVVECFTSGDSLRFLHR